MNKEVFVNVMVNKAKALSQIRFWDYIERVSPFLIEERIEGWLWKSTKSGLQWKKLHVSKEFWKGWR